MGAGINEDERGLGAGDFHSHGVNRMASALAGPRRRAVGIEDKYVEIRTGIGQQDADVEVEDAGGSVLDGGREVNAAQVAGKGLQSGGTKHQLVAAFGLSKGVDLIENQTGNSSENCRGFRTGEQEGEGLGSGAVRVIRRR